MARRKRRRPHGHGTVYQRGPGNFWVALRVHGRQRYWSGYATYEEAERSRAKLAEDLRAGKIGLEVDEGPLPTFAELVEKWLERRALSHPRSIRDDRCRMKLHLLPAFGKLTTPEIDHAAVRKFIEGRLAAKLSSSTVRHCVGLLSVVFGDLVERKKATANPVANLPGTVRKLIRVATKASDTPYLENMRDVERVYAHLAEPFNVMFALGAFAGLRTGEVLGVDWQDVDLEARRIRVRRQVHDGRLAILKDSEPRTTLIQTPLLAILKAWKLATGGTGLLFAPAHPTRGGRPDLERPPAFIRPHTLHRHLEKALEKCKLPADLTWYQCTRHTFASQWVLCDGSIEKLSKLMGHSSITTTERYAHLRAANYGEAEYGRLTANLSSGGKVVPMQKPAESGTNDYAVTTQDGQEADTIVSSA